MSTTTKRLLVITCLGAFLCVVVGGIAGIAGFGLLSKQVAQGMSTEPARIQTMTNVFVHYELPPGYVEQMGMDLFVYKMVLIGPSARTTGEPTIFLTHFQSTNMSPEQMSRQIQQSVEQQGGSSGLSMKVVETRQVTIDGHQTTLTVSEGGATRGYVIRQWIVAFPGKTGTILVLIQGSVDQWDDTLMDTFLASLKT